MKFSVVRSLFFISFILISCNNKSAKKNNDVLNTSTKDSANVEIIKNQKNNKQVGNEVYFRATGNEPFWGLEISESQIKLTTIGDSLVIPSTVSTHAIDANVKMYKIQEESNEMAIQIVESECANTMSGALSPYTVTIEYKKNFEETLTKLQGCGHYITDYRLHDTWVLDRMNGSELVKENFNGEFPVIEINSATNQFTGYAGCNHINGTLIFEKELLRFTKITTTDKMCEASNKEAQFLKALQSSTTYRIANSRLTLSNPDGELLVFKKID